MHGKCKINLFQIQIQINASEWKHTRNAAIGTSVSGWTYESNAWKIAMLIVSK